MADDIVIKPSDVIVKAADEVGDTLAAIRAQWLRAAGDDRDQLRQQYDELLAKLQLLYFREVKEIDRDPRIRGAVQQLANLTLIIAKTTQEMTTARRAIDGAVK